MSLPVTSGLIGWYKGEAWNGTSWPDLSGNGNNCTEIKGTINSSGRFMYGTKSDGVRFPTAILPSTYTLFHVAMYNGANRERIFDGVDTNWLSGFWRGKTGVTYHGNWLTQLSTTAFPFSNVLVSTDQKALYRANGTNLTINSLTYSSDRLSINWGYYSSPPYTENSDWAVFEVIVYNRELSLSEIESVESYLNARMDEIDLDMIRDNLGGTNPISFGDYYDNSGYLPSSGQFGYNNFKNLFKVISYPVIPVENLQLMLDATNSGSYPGSGTAWYDISGNGNHFTINALAYKQTYMDFQGSYGVAKRVINGALTDIGPYPEATIVCVCEILGSNANWRTLVRGVSADHQVIINSGGYSMGMFDNNVSGFLSSGFDVRNLPPGYNVLVWKLSQSSPYYQFTYNDTGVYYNITNANATFTNGFCCVGGTNNGNIDVNVSDQYFGKVITFMLYNRFLSAPEITALHTKYIPPVYGIPGGNLQVMLDATNSGSYPGSGTAWYDISGNGRNGTWSGTPSYNVGGFFNTNGLTCTGPASNSFGITDISGYTIFITWYQYGLTQPVTFQFYRTGTGNETRGIYSHCTWIDTNIYFDQGWTGSTNPRIYGACPNPTGTWHTTAFVRETNSTTMKIYLDGSLLVSGTGATTNLSLSSTAVNYVGPGGAWNAALRCFIAYNRGLSAPEITALHTKYIP